MEFVCYDSWDQLPESASTLFAEAAHHSVFFSRAWFESLIHAPVEGRRILLLACVVEGDRVLALMPLEERGPEYGYALANIYSSLYTLLVGEHRRREAIECLAAGLSQLRFSSFRLEPIAADDRNVKEFQHVMESLGFDCHRTFRFHNWIHRIDGRSFAEYMASRPGRLRNSIARKERKLARDHGYTIRLITDRDPLPEAMADYNTVYQRSWKARELYGEFVEGLVRRLSAQGWLRLAILYVEQRPVAAQLWFLVHGRASIFKLAYDEAWKRHSPGSILTKYLIRHVIDNDKVREIDFLTGNDAYKQDWMSERRERWALYCIRRPQPTQGLRRLFGRLRRMN